MDEPNTPMIQILLAENGYIITAYSARYSGGAEIAEIIGPISGGEDPGEVLKKAFKSQQLKESTRRKPIEHHIAKSKDELMMLLGEILSTLKGDHDHSV